MKNCGCNRCQMNVWCVFCTIKTDYKSSGSLLLHIFDSEDSAKAWIESHKNSEAYCGTTLFYEPRPLRTERDRQ